MHGTRLGRALAIQPPWRASRADRGGRHRNLVPMPARRGREAPVVEDAAAGRPGRRGFSKLRTRGREAPIAVEKPLVPSRRPGSGYPHSRYPFPPPCTARGSAAPVPPSHRGVHRALTVEDDTGTSSQGPRRPRVAFRTPRPVEALRIRLRAQPVPVPPSLHGTRLSRACATQPRGLQFARDRAI